MSKVSVIIPTYNRSHLLPRAVRSARASGADVEVIVVDDASTDDTSEVCKSLDDILYFRTESNVGQGAARNIGIQASTSEYIAFLDDDDLRLPKTLDLQLQVLQASPEASLVYGQVQLGDSDCEPKEEFLLSDFPEGDIFWKLLVRNFLLPTSVIVRKKCLLELGLFDPAPEKIGCEDYDLWLRLAEKYSAVAYREPVAIYRRPTLASGQATSDEAKVNEANKRMQALGFRLSKAIQDPEKCRQTLIEIRDVESDMLIWRAHGKLGEGNSSDALRKLVSAIKLHPRRALRPWTILLLLTSLMKRLF